MMMAEIIVNLIKSIMAICYVKEKSRKVTGDSLTDKWNWST